MTQRVTLCYDATPIPVYLAPASPGASQMANGTLVLTAHEQQGWDNYMLLSGGLLQVSVMVTSASDTCFSVRVRRWRNAMFSYESGITLYRAQLVMVVKWYSDVGESASKDNCVVERDSILVCCGICGGWTTPLVIVDEQRPLSRRQNELPQH